MKQEKYRGTMWNRGGHANLSLVIPKIPGWPREGQKSSDQRDLGKELCTCSLLYKIYRLKFLTLVSTSYTLID